MPTRARPMGVFNEWGKLREVLVGESAGCVFPRWSPGSPTIRREQVEMFCAVR